MTQVAIHLYAVNHLGTDGPHESEVMRKLVESMDENGVVEEDDGPWVALVVISAKPHQENVPWNE